MTDRRIRLLLPLIMTGVQLALLAVSLIVHREPWVIATPPVPQSQTPSDCSGEDCTVTFSPSPEPRAGRILMMAMVINLPAVFLGAVLHIAAALLHFPPSTGEPALLGFCAIFVPLIWYRVGRWVDDLATGGTAGDSVQFGAKALWTLVARGLVWFLFAIMLLSLLVERHRETNTTMVLQVISILWTAAYLVGGFVDDRRRAARLRSFYQ